MIDIEKHPFTLTKDVLLIRPQTGLYFTRSFFFQKKTGRWKVGLRSSCSYQQSDGSMHHGQGRFSFLTEKTEKRAFGVVVTVVWAWGWWGI